MTPEELRHKLQVKRGHAAYLAELFESLMGFTPTNQQCMIWLNRFDVDICAAAIERTGEFLLQYNQEADEEIRSGNLNYGEKTQTDLLRYASGCMYKMKDKADDLV